MINRIAATAALVLIVALGVLSPVPAWATSSFGAPVTAIGSSFLAIDENPGDPLSTENSAHYNSTTGEIKFFIPLSEPFNGVFGVTSVPHPPGTSSNTAGTIADSGSGTGIGSSYPTALIMYLSFSPVDINPSTAELVFSFTDLDLYNVNDPSHFFEAVQFFDADANAMSSLITISPLSYTGSPFDYTVSGNSNSQTITFPNISSIVTKDPFFAKLQFQSKYKYSGTNTPEYLIATLTTTEGTTEIPVPEPATLLLLGSGLAGLGLVRRRKLG